MCVCVREKLERVEKIGIAREDILFLCFFFCLFCSRAVGGRKQSGPGILNFSDTVASTNPRLCDLELEGAGFRLPVGVLV